MTSVYLLDTNILSEPTRAAPHASVIQKISASEGRLATSSIVWSELIYGVERLARGDRRDRLESYLYGIIAPAIEILPYDRDTAALHARERARLASEGFTPSFADGQIAATAIARELILVTRNVKDFTRFERLRIENWFQPSSP